MQSIHQGLLVAALYANQVGLGMQLLPSIKRFAVMATLIVAALAVPEIVARIFIPSWAPPISDKPSLFVVNPYTGWLNPPSATFENHRGKVVSSNHLGLRDAEPGAKTRPRILFLGDSFTWGWGITNEERYTERLQSKLPNMQVINAGITGFGTLQEVLLLKHYVDEIQPDYVVLQMYKNDFLDNLTPDGVFPHPYIDHLNHFALTRYPAPHTDQSLFLQGLVYVGEHTYFYRQLVIRLYVLWMKLNIGTNEPPRPEPTHEDLATGMKLSLEMLYQFCAERKIPLMVFSYQLEDYQSKLLSDVSSEFSVPVYSVDPAFVGITEDYEVANDAHGHWNGYGSQLVADYLLPHIVSMISTK